MDGLDAQAPARGIEYLREKPARAIAHRRAEVFAQMFQLQAEVRIGQSHPMGESFAQPIGHFRSTGLGERQTKYGRRRCTAKEQTKDSRRQDVGLAGSRRSRERSMDERIRCGCLCALKLVERLQPAAHDAKLSKLRRSE